MSEKLSNPAPLGLIGFGMTTLLLNLANAGFFALGTVIVAMGIFCGGIAQMIAGAMEYKKGNTFGTTAFVFYGAFWLSLVAIILLPAAGLPAAGVDFVFYLIIWGVFSGFMFIGTMKKNVVLMIVFASLTVLFFMLALGEMLRNIMIIRIAGYIGIVCGSCAIYLAMAEVLNETYGKTILPIGEKR